MKILAIIAGVRIAAFLFGLLVVCAGFLVLLLLLLLCRFYIDARIKMANTVNVRKKMESAVKRMLS